MREQHGHVRWLERDYSYQNAGFADLKLKDLQRAQHLVLLRRALERAHEVWICRVVSKQRKAASARELEVLVLVVGNEKRLILAHVDGLHHPQRHSDSLFFFAEAF